MTEVVLVDSDENSESLGRTNLLGRLGIHFALPMLPRRLACQNNQVAQVRKTMLPFESPISDIEAPSSPPESYKNVSVQRSLEPLVQDNDSLMNSQEFSMTQAQWK